MHDAKKCPIEFDRFFLLRNHHDYLTILVHIVKNNVFFTLQSVEIWVTFFIEIHTFVCQFLPKMAILTLSHFTGRKQHWNKHAY